MYIFLIIVLLSILAFLKRDNYSRKYQKKKVIQNTDTETSIDFTKCYQRNWMFSYHEKDIFREIKKITDNHNLLLFAKVRLFDLVMPIKNNPHYKTCLYKIQSKHVDYVICDQKLVARYIIELDDASHDTTDRKERDQFVDSVLKANGYKVLHIKAFDENLILQFLDLQTPSTTV